MTVSVLETLEVYVETSNIAYEFAHTMCKFPEGLEDTPLKPFRGGFFPKRCKKSIWFQVTSNSNFNKSYFRIAIKFQAFLPAIIEKLLGNILSDVSTKNRQNKF